jgi:RNA polymerase sporulation-specific sigma factor
MSSIALTESFEESVALGELDSFLSSVKEHTMKKIAGKTFAGMETDDVLQECLVKVYTSIDKFDSSKSTAGTFFDNIIDNRISDLLRRAGMASNLAVVNATELVEPDSFEEQVLPSNFMTVISMDECGYNNFELKYDFLESIDLNDTEKRVFKLRCAGYDFVEIASIMQTSKSWISQIWKRVMKKYESGMAR